MLLSDDLLDGADAIGGFIGVTPRTVYRLAETGCLPVIRMGRRIYGRKSEIEKAFSSSQAAA